MLLFKTTEYLFYLSQIHGSRIEIRDYQDGQIDDYNVRQQRNRTNDLTEKKVYIYLVYPSYEFYFYKPYRSSCLNNFTNVLSVPFDFVKGVFGLPVIIVTNVSQFIWFSPSFVYYGFHRLLTIIDNYLTPPPSSPPPAYTYTTIQ
jgi:hypothetical protein